MKGSTVPPNKFFSAVGLFCILVLNLYLGCCRLLVALECILIDFSLHPKKKKKTKKKKRNIYVFTPFIEGDFLFFGERDLSKYYMDYNLWILLLPTEREKFTV